MSLMNIKRTMVGVAGAAFLAGAWGVARADLAESVELAIEQAMNEKIGTEIQASMSGSASGVNLQVNLQGLAFCLPPVPTAEPNPTPTPPNNAYGCVNAAQVTVSTLPDGSGGEATIQLQPLFIDLVTIRDRTMYCGEFGSGSVTRTGYALTDCTIHANFELVREGGCLRLGAVSSDLGPVDWHFGDNCLNTLAPMIPLITSMLDASIDEFFRQLMEVVFTDASPALCSIDWCNLQWPPTLVGTVGEPSDVVYGQIWIDGVTNQPGPTSGLVAELGHGPLGSDPAADPGAWLWTLAAYNVDSGNNDEFMARITPSAQGVYDYAYRYSRNSGPWTYGDLDGSTNGYSPDQAGHFTVTGPTDVASALPERTTLHPNQPNPFHSLTTIRFNLAAAGPVRLSVYDVTGRLVRTLIATDMPAGGHAAPWDGRDSDGRAVGSGCYTVRLESRGKVESLRMALMR